MILVEATDAEARVVIDRVDDTTRRRRSWPARELRQSPSSSSRAARTTSSVARTRRCTWRSARAAASPSPHGRALCGKYSSSRGNALRCSGGEAPADPRRRRPSVREEGLSRLPRERHRRGGGRRLRARLPLLRVEGRRPRGDLPRDVGDDGRGDQRGRGASRSRRASSCARAARSCCERGATTRTSCACSCARWRGAASSCSARSRRSRTRSRRSSASSSAARQQKRVPRRHVAAGWRRGSIYGALEEILTGWVLGRLPGDDDDIREAERAVVGILCDGLVSASPSPRA